MKKNTFFHLLVTRYSLLVIATFILWMNVANASALYFNPQDRITVPEGESVVVEIYLDTEGKVVNALEASVKFDPTRISVLDVSRGESVIPLWIREPVADNAAGIASFTGGIPGGINFSSGLIARLTLLGMAAGEATLSWDASSQVLLNDGLGTADALELMPTPVIVEPPLTDVPALSSRSHPDQAGWYRNPTFTPSWTLTPGVLYSYLLDHDPRGLPDEIPDTPNGTLRFDGTLKYENLSEGIYYFHLREGIKERGRILWSRPRTYRAQIDPSPPGTVEAIIGSDPLLFDGKYFLSFNAADTLSGIAHIDVREETTGWVEDAHQPYLLYDADARGTVRVRAVDRAGNMSQETEVAYPSVALSHELAWDLAALLAAFVLGAAAWYLRNRD